MTAYYYLRDGDLVYREPSELGALQDVFLEGKWQAASGDLFPSEQDMDHMRPISKESADKLIAAQKG
jgi:hypothetical protein